VRQALEVAQDDRHPESLGQPGDLGIEHRPELAEFGLVRRRTAWVLDVDLGMRPGPPPRPIAAGARGDPERHTVQPVRQQLAVAQRARPADQDQERRLERILHVVRIVEQPPADAQDHRAVPRHDRLKRDLVALAREPRQELPLRQTRYGPPAEQPLNRPQNAPGPLTNRHFRATPSPIGGHGSLIPPDTAGRGHLNRFFRPEEEMTAR
jgi:hypothetical protein